MIGPSDGAPRLFDPATPGLRSSLQSVFLQWLLACAAVFGLIIWLLRRFLKRHYSAPLTALIALRQRESLADIGKTVAKINHDMRNVLSSATLVADTLIASEDLRVRRAALHVVRSPE